MANFVFIDNGRIRPASGTRIIEAAEYAEMLEPQQVLDAARKQAVAIIQDSEAIFQTEKSRGFQEGLREARQQMAEQITATAVRCEQYCGELKEQTVLLVMAVVQKVLQGIEPRQLVEAQVKKALSHFKGSKRVVLTVHPDRAEMLRSKLSDIMAGCAGIDIIDIKPNPNLPPEQVILESETGIVDASMDIQLAAIEQAFKNDLFTTEEI